MTSVLWCIYILDFCFRFGVMRAWIFFLQCNLHLRKIIWCLLVVYLHYLLQCKLMWNGCNFKKQIIWIPHHPPRHSLIWITQCGLKCIIYERLIRINQNKGTRYVLCYNKNKNNINRYGVFLILEGFFPQHLFYLHCTHDLVWNLLKMCW